MSSSKEKIIEVIKNNGPSRPADFAAALNLKPVTIHRHLKSMVEEGKLKPKGKPPHTRYALAGVPDLESVAGWMNSDVVAKNPTDIVSETRDVFAARLTNLIAYTREGLSQSFLPLVLSTTGEIGNNSFDHNLGQWRDVPGCWFQSEVTGGSLWICIADRGQGIFGSLTKVHKNFKDEQTALEAAFETIISGRTPEQRGNGLKYVKSIVVDRSGAGLACVSGTASICYGDVGKKGLSFLKDKFGGVSGTITLLSWKLQS